MDIQRLTEKPTAILTCGTLKRYLYGELTHGRVDREREDLAHREAQLCPHQLTSYHRK